MVEKKRIDIEPGTTLTLRDVIEILMKEKEELRGNDLQLVCNVWANFIVAGMSDEYSMEDIKPILETFDHCFQIVEMCHLPTYDSISRIRRDIQRTHPELQPSEPIKKLRKQRQERIRKMFETEEKRNKLNKWLEEGEQQKHE